MYTRIELTESQFDHVEWLEVYDVDLGPVSGDGHVMGTGQAGTARVPNVNQLHAVQVDLVALGALAGDAREVLRTTDCK